MNVGLDHAPSRVGLLASARQRAATLAMLAMLAMLAILGVAARSVAQAPTAVLVLHTYGPNTPTRLAMDATLARTFREAAGSNVDLYIETIDPNRFVGDQQSRVLRTYLRERYAGKRIDVIATVYDRALSFTLDRRDPLLPEIPVAALLSRYPQTRSERVAITWSGPTFGETATLALQLQPQTRTIFIVDGVPPAEGSDFLHAEARRQIADAAPHVKLLSLQNLPLDVLLQRVRTLPRDAVIIFVRQVIGPAGTTIAPFDAVKALTAASPVPVYVNADIQIGTGAVGGVVVTVEQEAHNLAVLALRVARDGPNRPQPHKNLPTPVVDWRQLQRWGISDSRLPEGSEVRFRERGLWEQYKYYVVAGATVVVLQAGLIAALVAQGVRRHRTAAALRESERRARIVADQNRDLAGRLINAQEAERTRIARDLHDDVSQEAAGLSILLSSLRRLLSTAPAPATIDEIVADVQQRAIRIGDTVRYLSHQLHPGLLEHVGLVAALTQHCAELRIHHGLAIVLQADDELDEVDDDVALCLYRIAQEALTNAIRHARARSVNVVLRRTETGIALRIVDDGVGFDAGARGRTGVGLRSIDERARLAGGAAVVETSPGQGTVVSVHVPLATAARATVSRPD